MKNESSVTVVRKINELGDEFLKSEKKCPVDILHLNCKCKSEEKRPGKKKGARGFRVMEEKASKRTRINFGCRNNRKSLMYLSFRNKRNGRRNGFLILFHNQGALGAAAKKKTMTFHFEFVFFFFFFQLNSSWHFIGISVDHIGT